MSDTRLSQEQSHLIAELSATYGIEPEEIVFFGDDPRPFFTYEATCVLCNKLTDLQGIDIEPTPNGFIDSLAYRCTLTQKDGSRRSSVGVANLKETLSGGILMTESQLNQMASGRAIRSALRVAGIDLLKLHHQAKGSSVQFAAEPSSNYQKLLREAHVLGFETGYIFDVWKSGEQGSVKEPNKLYWHSVLKARYLKPRSSDLTEYELADFVAFLRSQLPSRAAA